MLTNNKVALIEHFIDRFIIIYLILFTEHIAGRHVDACHGIRAVLCDHPRFAQLRPVFHLFSHGAFRRVQISAEHIPSVIPVGADDVHLRSRDISCVIILADHKRYRTVLGIALMRQMIQRHEVIMRRLGLFLCIRLIGDRPYRDTGMVLVPCDQITDHLLVMLLCPELRVSFIIPAEVQSDRGCLVDHDDPQTVAQIEHLFRIRIMRSTEGVSAHPLHQGEVFYVHRLVDPSSVYLTVFVLAESLEVEGSSVDEELCSPDLDRTHAELLFIQILSELHLRGIEIRVSRLPEAGILNNDRPFSSLRACHLIPFFVQEVYDHLCFCLFAAVHTVADLCVLSLDLRHKHDITDIGLRSRIDLDRTVDARVVEEVKVRGIMRLWNCHIDTGDIRKL